MLKTEMKPRSWSKHNSEKNKQEIIQPANTIVTLD